MSTEHQQYSTDNQSAAIRRYAEQRGYEIVRTYADEGKSGLNFAGRQALQRLLEDVEAGRANFSVLVVYDVGRWGRFQDPDEAASYELWCRRAGVQVHYCAELRRLKPMRQIRAAEMMVAMNRFSMGYVKSIVAATPADQLVEGKRPAVRGLNAEQIDLMTEESARLDREFKLIDQSYGADHLDLVLASAYVTGLLINARVVRHLAQVHADLLQEFQKIAEVQKAA